MKKLISLLAGFAFPFFVSAQTIQHVDLSVETEFIDSSGTALIKNNPKVLVDLVDTSNVSQIEIALYNAENNTQIITKTFNYNSPGEFSDGTYFNRSSDLLLFGMGRYNLRSYTATFRVKYSNGSYSNTLNLTSN